MPRADGMREGDRLLTICNACRYCEGYCAVFPAMERRLEFSDADLNYLANLCHNCAECYYACQYAPPHPFAVNLPKALAEIRLRSYQQYAWPRPLAKVFQRNGLLVAVLLVVSLTLAMLGASRMSGVSSPGDFYSIVSHAVMVLTFGAAGIFVVFVWLVGLARFWKESGESLASFTKPRALVNALRDILKLEYLSSGGAGCTYPDERHSQARRWFHHFTFYGFLLCFAATCVAAFYDSLLGWKAPYPFLSLPVVLGTAGGVGLLIGPAGLWTLKSRRDRAIVDRNQDGMDVAFIALLLATSFTGLLLLVLRDTSAMSSLLMVHLAMVLVLFITLPYGKFVHGIYRSAALVRYGLERLRSPEGR